MKKQHIVLIVLLILLADQALKIYIKTTFHLHDSVKVLGSWFQLYFVENPGMAYGWKFGGEWGKVALTVFRILAVIFGTWYIGKIIRDKRHKGFIICATLIYAGAIGNLIDRLRYGFVVDFISWHWKNTYYFPTFNVADICITVGTGLLILYIIKEVE